MLITAEPRTAAEVRAASITVSTTQICPRCPHPHKGATMGHAPPLLPRVSYSRGWGRSRPAEWTVVIGERICIGERDNGGGVGGAVGTSLMEVR